MFESPPPHYPQVSVAGLSVVVVPLLLGYTGLMTFLYCYLPLSVVRGVQLSQGLYHLGGTSLIWKKRNSFLAFPPSSVKSGFSVVKR
ncbi:hypothetical protein K1719_031423 [Acacia pycnantha]|nr:hypothetical protein K1719_045967 [Acacia pycnantha]KAI9086829.1 hypothetical protein K1719_031423 [Acacia pycnantha]